MSILESELREFWCGYEATIGFRSTFSAMLAAHAGVALGEGPPAGWDPYAEVIDSIVDGTRVYRTLRRLPTATLVVLYKLYGPRNSRNEHPQLGELAPLASLTQAAEDARDAMVLEESSRLSDTVGSVVEADTTRRRPELEEMFWREVGEITKATDAFSRARKVERQAKLQKRVTAGWVLLGKLLDAYTCDGVIRARIGAIESTDRRVTVEDAIRARLKAKDTAFVAEVLCEARSMRNDAREAYRAARRDELTARRCVKLAELLFGAA